MSQKLGPDPLRLLSANSEFSETHSRERLEGPDDSGAHASSSAAVPAPGQDPALDATLLTLVLFNEDEEQRREGVRALWHAALPALPVGLGFYAMLDEGKYRSATTGDAAALREALEALTQSLGDRHAEELSALRAAIGRLDELAQATQRGELGIADWPVVLSPTLPLPEGALAQASPRVAATLIWRSLGGAAQNISGLRSQVADALGAWGYSPRIYQAINRYRGQLEPLLDRVQQAVT